MPVTIPNSGSQTAILGTEHVLATITTEGVYQLEVDAANLVNGENLTLKIYGKVRSTDTEALIYEAHFENAQVKQFLQSLAVPTPHHAKFTLEQNGGIGRAFPWGVYRL